MNSIPFSPPSRTSKRARDIPKRLLRAKLFALCSALVALPALALPITLTFEGVGDLASIEQFYGGGTDSFGNSGPNLGVTFLPSAQGLLDSDAGGSGAISGQPSGKSALIFQRNGPAILNFAAGFEVGLSFFYATPFAPGGPVAIYDDVNGTGALLAVVNLPSTLTGPANSNDEYKLNNPFGVTFSGVAKSVSFGGSDNGIVYDNITLGSAQPVLGPNPAIDASEPHLISALALLALGFAIRQRRASSSIVRRQF